MLTVKVDMDEAITWTNLALREVPFATALSLTRTAQDVKAAEIATMRQVFDRPTRYVLDALYVRPATKSNLTAEVGFKDAANSRRLSAWDVLGPHIEGGGRRQRWSEIKIFDNYYVPTKYAKLDTHGNFPGSEIVRIMAQLKLLDDPLQHATGSRRSRANRLNLTYFKAGLKLGEGAIMMRNGKHDAVPILVEVRAPQYRKRFPYWDVANKTIADRLPVNWKAAVQYAMGTAKP